jgi:S-adenosyl-L-methionine hydrolase (adenosine-forming)
MQRVTLTTDFGTRDTYVAQLKAELYRRGPDSLQVVDLSHEIAAQNVREAALFVAATLPRFPAGTIHLVVVDPGVGSARRPVCVSAFGHWLVGPDNGVFSLLCTGNEAAVEIDPIRLGLPPPSATFHGRDLFAPAAAALACGRPFDDLGPPAASLVRLPWPGPSRSGQTLTGEVIHIDRFGNLITNLERADGLALSAAGPLVARFRSRSLPLVNHYAEQAEGALLALWDSSDRLELAARNASAARISGGRIGDEVQLGPEREPD